MKWKKKFGLIIGAVLLIVLGSIGTYITLNSQKSSKVTKTVDLYLHAITFGQQKEALKYLTGEAEVIVSKQPAPIPDKLQTVQYKNVKRQNHLAQVEAVITTEKDRLSERFFLVQQDGIWKITHVETISPEWSGLKKTTLLPDQKNVIESYIAKIADGDINSAKEALAGNAAIKAKTFFAQQPQQFINIESMDSIGQTLNGSVLVQVGISQTGMKQTILFTLGQIGTDEWMITDVLLLDRKN